MASLKRLLSLANGYPSAIPVPVLATIPDLPTHWPDFARLLQIRSAGKVVPFDPYPYQIEVIEAIEKAQNITICKSRQMGMSELICSYLLMRALTEPGFAAVVFSKTQKDSSDLGGRIRDMALSLGDRCPPFETESKTQLRWLGLGRLEFLPVTARAARAIPSVSVAFFDEEAFIDGVQGVYQAAAPTLAMLGDRGKIINNSTPNGKQGLYWDLLSSDGQDADRVMLAIQEIRKPENPAIQIWGDAGETKILLHYHGHPVYGQDPDWPARTRAKLKMTLAQWKQEFELDFLESGALVFDGDAVDRCATGIFLPALPGRSYLAGTDPSFGGGDAFVTQVWDITERPYSLVASYSAAHKSNDANLANTAQLYYEYRPAVAAVETNGGGSLILQELAKSCQWLRLEPVHTTAMSKLINTDRLALMLEREALQFPLNSGFHRECRHFIERQSGKSRVREAESGHHDDEVMAAGVAFACLELATGANWIDGLLGD